MTQKNETIKILDTILGIIGIFSIVAILYHAFKNITTKTETNVISGEALRVLNNPIEAKKLRQAVDKYHETGDWSKTKLETIL